MSRNEIGNYLGLAVETVSRIFTRFQKASLLHVEGKEVHIEDIDQLYRLSGELQDSEKTEPLSAQCGKGSQC
jgi:CRP/FNR family transcriptional regulator